MYIKKILYVFAACLFNAVAGAKTYSLTMPCKLLNGITEREYSIYLPDGSSMDNGKLKLDSSYPVLYLLHGGGGSHTDFERNHHIAQFLDSLIANGTIKPMIVVMPEANQ